MIDRQKMNKKIMFQIQKHQNKYLYLELSPLNYQQQFIDFVKHNHLSKQQAQQLKKHVENTIHDKVVQIKQIQNRLQKRIRNQKFLIKNEQNEKQSNDQENNLQKYITNKTQHRNLSQIGIQVCDQPIRNQKFMQLSFQNKNDQINQNTNNLSRSNINQQQYHVQSPRFKQLQAQIPQSQNKIIFNCNLSEEDIKPRQFPFNISLSHNKSTQANSPSTHKNKMNSQKEYPVFYYSDRRTPNKPLLLQNYRKTKNKVQKIKKFQQVSFQYQSNKHPNPHIYNRLYETHTLAFKNKNMQQINTKQLQIYNQFLKQTQNIPKLKVSEFQDMSSKTTKCFQARIAPQINTKQIKQQIASKISFLEHLKKKQLQKQKLNKILSKQKQFKIFQAKGSHCQYKLIRQKAEKQQKQIEEKQQMKQKQVRQRIKYQKQQNMYRDLSKKSCSPPSKSRICLVCKPSSPSKNMSLIGKKQKSKLLSMGQTQSNKKYVSNILKEAFQQFTQEIRQI